MRKVILKCNGKELIFELRDTLTADIIYNSLPLKSKIQKWGKEIYFEIGLRIELEKTLNQL